MPLTHTWPFFVDLARPVYLLGLLAVPLVVVLSVRSLAGLGAARCVIAISLRCLVIVAMILALSEPELVRKTDEQTVVFAVDESESIADTHKRASQGFVRQAAREMRPCKDRVAVLSFAGRASVEQVAKPELTAERVSAAGQPHRTNLAGALRLGMALFPSDTAKRLVVVSDGNENAGLSAREADAYAALGIPIDVVPLRYEHAAEVLVDQLSAPASAKLDEVVNLQLLVRSQVATEARLTLYRNERTVNLSPDTPGMGIPIQLASGPNRFTIPVTLSTAGVQRFRAVVQTLDADADSNAVNNEGRALTIVGAADRVTIVTDADGNDREADTLSAEILGNALRDGGITYDLVSVNDLPDDAAVLADRAALILSNVSASALGPARLEMLESYVRDQGGGLIAVGGDQSFSVGGYAHTPLEEILPVETSRAKLQILGLNMVIVIDRSGSMAGEKLSMACQAASGAVKLLGRLDRIGVIAFDGSPEWVVPLQSAADHGPITHRIAAIGAGGGTVMHPALDQARLALARVERGVKHMIVLTDGQSTPGPFEALARACRDSKITISTIAVGPDADRGLLSALARLSNGRMYIANNAQPLPQIFARETVLASRSGLFEQPFTPQVRPTPSELMLVGLAPAGIPQLHGHVVTSAKPSAQVALVRTTKEGVDPILAYWQVGLGRTVAFTSGLWPKWGPQWTAWPGFSKLWTQVVRHVARTSDPGDLEVETAINDGVAHVSVSAEHLSPRAQGSLMLSGTVIGPDYAVEPLSLPRTSLGRFEARFPLDAPGTYLLHLLYSYGTGKGERSGTLMTGVVQSYSQEYCALNHDEYTLVDLAQRTGGRLLDIEHPEAVFEQWSVRPVQVRRPFWEDLVRLALVLFLMDVAVRRIAVTPREVVERIRRFVRELAGPRDSGAAAATLDGLRGAKARALPGDDRVPERGRSPTVTFERPESEEADALTRTLNELGPDAPVVATPSCKKRPPATSEGDYTSRLLRAKRRARGDDDRSEGR